MKVEFIIDKRPMPDNCPCGMEEAAFDDSLIIKYSGEVLSSTRNIFGKWLYLVLCDDGEMREIDAFKCKIINKTT